MAYRYIVQNAERKDDILLLTLTPKRRGRALSFEPGQYAAIGFIRGGRPTPMRCFSIVSSPSSGVLQFAMRIRGDFTQTATTLQPGHVIRVQGPFGDFTVNPDYDRKIVMLAGGIGITPFLSMIRYATERQLKLPISLLFSNRSANSIPFADQLQALAQQNPYLQIQFFTTDTTGNITEQHIQQLVASHGVDTTYLVCGPKGFSNTVQTSLHDTGVHESRILSESFTQSSALMTSSGVSLHKLVYGLSAATMVLATGAIMTLDLRQNLPKLTAVHTVKPNQNTAQSTTDDNSSSPSDDSSSNSTTNSAPTTTPSATPAPTQSSPSSTPSPSSSTSTSGTSGSSGYTNYQSPISSVS